MSKSRIGESARFLFLLLFRVFPSRAIPRTEYAHGTAARGVLTTDEKRHRLWIAKRYSLFAY